VWQARIAGAAKDHPAMTAGLSWGGTVGVGEEETVIVARSMILEAMAELEKISKEVADSKEGLLFDQARSWAYITGVGLPKGGPFDSSTVYIQYIQCLGWLLEDLSCTWSFG
jgi:hypothetical protein